MRHREKPKMNCRLGRPIYYGRLKTKSADGDCHRVVSSIAFEIVSKQFERQWQFFRYLWQASVEYVLALLPMLLRCFLQQFLDNNEVATFRFCLQTEWQQISRARHFLQQRFYAKVVRDSKNR